MQARVNPCAIVEFTATPRSSVQCAKGAEPRDCHGDLERAGQRWRFTNATVRELTRDEDDEHETA